jgi:beta-barrel assembly-enhancing protease
MSKGIGLQAREIVIPGYQRVHIYDFAVYQTYVSSRQSIVESAFGGWVPIFDMRIGIICGVSLASICLLPAFTFGQTKRSRSDADVNAIGQRNIAGGPNSYSLEKERELGAILAQQVSSSSRFLLDSAITAYVNRVALKVEQNSDKHIPITIHLIDGEEVKSFTLPGGHLYITRGLLLRLENEGELASALARGTAHIALRSGTSIATKREMTGVYPNAGSSPGIQVMDLKYFRDVEYDADYFGVQYLYKSGYDPQCFLGFVQLVGEARGDTKRPVPEEFSPYPSVPLRLKALQKEITEILPKCDGAIDSTPEFQEFKNRLQAMKPEGASPQNLNKDN